MKRPAPIPDDWRNFAAWTLSNGRRVGPHADEAAAAYDAFADPERTTRTSLGVHCATCNHLMALVLRINGRRWVATLRGTTMRRKRGYTHLRIEDDHVPVFELVRLEAGTTTPVHCERHGDARLVHDVVLETLEAGKPRLGVECQRPVRRVG